MQALLRRVEVHVTVVRSGQTLEIPSSTIAVNDIVILSPGSIMPGDAVTLESNGLLVDESLLTGESFSIEKSEHDLLLAGTHVISGNAKARIMRGTEIIADDLTIDSLKRFKDDANEVKEGFECGIGLGNMKDLQIGDTIQVFEMREKKRA